MAFRPSLPGKIPVRPRSGPNSPVFGICRACFYPFPSGLRDSGIQDQLHKGVSSAKIWCVLSRAKGTLTARNTLTP